jgi:hypothetical protein
MIEPITSVKVTCISKNLQGVEDEIERDVVELIRESSVITALTALLDSMQATAPRRDSSSGTPGLCIWLYDIMGIEIRMIVDPGRHIPQRKRA